MKLVKIGLIALGLLISVNAQAIDLSGTFNNSKSIQYNTLDVGLRSKLDKELKCLANNIYYEAGSESFEGKVAVAQVSLNRAESGLFPDTICGVVSQRTVIAKKVVCQFSWFCSSKRNGPSSFFNEKYAEAMRVAYMVLVEGYRIPILEDAIYFHATHVRPNWGQPKVGKIGNHIFYSDRRVIDL